MLTQGDAEKIDIKITNDGVVVAPANVTKIEFIIYDYRKNKKTVQSNYNWFDDWNSYNHVLKTYPGNNITYSTDHFCIPLSQLETKNFGELVEVQARVLFTDGTIKLTKIFKMPVEACLFGEVMSVD